MKVLLYFLSILVFIHLFIHNKICYSANKGDQPLKVIFDKTYGAKDEEKAFCIQTKKYLGYIIAGHQISKRGDYDFYLLRLNSKGGLMWKKNYGHKSEEKATAVYTTKDGGFIVVGTALIGDNRGSDIWLIKLSSKGDVQWSKIYGKKAVETVNAVTETSDGSFLIAGSTSSEGKGFSDFLLIKFNKKGKLLWKKVIGGAGNDEAFAIHEIRGGGYIVAGSTGSKGAGGVDGWIVKLSPKGKILWDRTIGGRLTDEIFDIKQTKDNGYILTGYSDSYSTIWRDVWIIKLDQNGKTVWEEVLGEMGVDEGRSVIENRKGEYIIAGSYTSQETGFADIWILKIDKNGKKVWEQAFGNKKEDKAYSIVEDEHGAYVVTGYSTSAKGENIDIRVIKLKEK